mmetsp:Transcript_91040/g.229539  ORF Transcript_91040/g.229539 Transcript_91040/m.229539 type:complete len:405 (-) Transcript_91040:101-1315(-)
MQAPQIAGLLSKVQEQAGALVGATGGGNAAPAPSPGSLPKIFVGGLAQHTTRDSLNQYFGQFGSVDSVVMMDKSTGRSRGFGFVDFSDEAVMQHVLQYSHQIDGSNVTCSAYANKNGGGGGAQPVNISTGNANDILASAMGSISKLQDQIATQIAGGAGGGLDALGGCGGGELDGGGGGSSVPGKLFVAELTQDETTEMLQEAMAQFGPCECEVVIDKRSGRSRGFGFARFLHEADMLSALAAQIYVNGKLVEVSECWGKGQEPRGYKGSSKGGGGKGGKGDGKGGSIAVLKKGLQKAGVLPGGRWTNDQGALYVRGLPADTTNADLYEIFSPFGAIPAQGCWAMTAEDGTCKGYAFINFIKDEDAQNAIATLNGTMMPDGSTLEVKPKGAPKPKPAKGESKGQ